MYKKAIIWLMYMMVWKNSMEKNNTWYVYDWCKHQQSAHNPQLIPPQFCTFFVVPYLPTWGPAGNTWRGYSRLRSGREHWAWMVVVEVRQGTLGGDGRGWGPAGNTGRGWSWLRSGREHWAWMVVVEVRQRTLCVEGRSWAGGRGGRGGRGRGGRGGRRGGGGGEQATDIKSNNPHLAGGEQLETSHRSTEMFGWIKWFIVGCSIIIYPPSVKLYHLSSRLGALPCLPTLVVCKWRVANRQPLHRYFEGYMIYPVILTAFSNFREQFLIGQFWWMQISHHTLQ